MQYRKLKFAESNQCSSYNIYTDTEIHELKNLYQVFITILERSDVFQWTIFHSVPDANKTVLILLLPAAEGAEHVSGEALEAGPRGSGRVSGSFGDDLSGRRARAQARWAARRERSSGHPEER